MENDELKNNNEEVLEPSSDSGDISEQELPNEEKKEESNDEKIQELFSDYVMKMPESEKDPEEPVIETPNRPAHWSQRIAAGLIDLCLLFLSVWGLYRAFISSGLGDSLRQESIRMQRVADQYKLVTLLPDSEETYGYKLYEGEEGYDDDFSTAVTITSSCEGLLVPPSHNMVIYAMSAGGISIVPSVTQICVICVCNIQSQCLTINVVVHNCNATIKSGVCNSQRAIRRCNVVATCCDILAISVVVFDNNSKFVISSSNCCYSSCERICCNIATC